MPTKHRLKIYKLPNVIDRRTSSCREKLLLPHYSENCGKTPFKTFSGHNQGHKRQEKRSEMSTSYCQEVMSEVTQISVNNYTQYSRNNLKHMIFIQLHIFLQLSYSFIFSYSFTFTEQIPSKLSHFLESCLLKCDCTSREYVSTKIEEFIPAFTN